MDERENKQEDLRLLAKRDGNIIRTHLGTELPLLNFKGKPYLMVAYRLVWFREVYPNHGVETSFLVLGSDHAVAKAVITDERGKIIATAHKHENEQGFVDFREKAETGAVGRALGIVGFGTQFAPEFDEEERLADSPIQSPKKMLRGATNTLPAQTKGQSVCTQEQLMAVKQLRETLKMEASAVMDMSYDQFALAPPDLSVSQCDELIVRLRRMVKDHV